MIRVADLVADLLVECNVSQMFMVTGGGAMHLNDAFGRHPGIDVVCCHHEQACAMAAESYARLSNRVAAVNVTTGPGGLNALNGVFGAYVDSVPMIVVSGQVKRETMVGSYTLPLRQLGDQEVDIAAIARPITKFAIVLEDPLATRSVFEQAHWLATHGRPGPVWIDIPIDVQAALVDETDLEGFNPTSLAGTAHVQAPLTGGALEFALNQALECLASSERPVILAGAGVRISGAYETFLSLISKLGVPVTTGWNAHDLIWDAHPLYAGRPGTIGDRAGNFAVQNADYLLVLGSRLNVRQISYNWQSFARAAYTVMIDIDAAELRKPTLSIDLPIHADLGEALGILDAKPAHAIPAPHREYLVWCQERRKRYPVLSEIVETEPEDGLDPYWFLDLLSRECEEGEVIVTGDGTACVVTFQVAEIKRGQRLYTNSGCASMGYDLPAAVGAAMVNRDQRVVCIAGDGSIMLNLQELQTIAGNQLPVKIFVLNNDGYSSIRQTQSNYFPGHIIGCDPASGITFPDFVAVAKAFGISCRLCAKASEANELIRATLDLPGPQLLEVRLRPDYPFAPKLASRQLDDGTMVSSPLEDMAPHLSRQELAENMLIPPFEEA